LGEVVQKRELATQVQKGGLGNYVETDR